MTTFLKETSAALMVYVLEDVADTEASVIVTAHILEKQTDRQTNKQTARRTRRSPFCSTVAAEGPSVFFKCAFMLFAHIHGVQLRVLTSIYKPSSHSSWNCEHVLRETGFLDMVESQGKLGMEQESIPYNMGACWKH